MAHLVLLLRRFGEVILQFVFALLVSATEEYQRLAFHYKFNRLPFYRLAAILPGAYIHVVMRVNGYPPAGMFPFHDTG